MTLYIKDIKTFHENNLNMENFIINNTNDFNMYLMQLISDDESKSDMNDNKCLITNEQLKDNNVKLACGHKFNYVPLIEEFINQKCNKSHYEVTHLSRFDLKCPYCRNIQRGTIPYYPNLYENKINGINWPPSKVSLNNYCKATFKSGKRKGEVCNKKCLNDYCKRHSKVKLKVSNEILCIKILKSGKRKGEMCNCKCKSEESKKNKLCKRHLKI
jgi:hypothetical protein